jgi:glucose-1-phosphate cytidylyltransferase
MKVVILAGGFGTRISEYTKSIPKPMIKVLGKPILLRIMDHYLKFGHKDFYIATGFKSKVIENYFKNFKNSKYNINIINTGLKTMTGGRLKKLKKYLNETFLMTYGDGLSNIKLVDLVIKYKNIYGMYKHFKVKT